MTKTRTPLDELTELLKNPPHYLAIDVYNERKKRMKRMGAKKKHKSKYTLDQIGDALFKFIKTTNSRFDKVEKRLDGFNTRLDYIVKANNLKDRM